MIKTSGLRKIFRSGKGRKATTVEAVRGVDLEVAEREIFGFLGPNGAGKTTTLRMPATLLIPDGGSANIAGADLLANPAEVRRWVGYVAQGGGTWDALTLHVDVAATAIPQIMRVLDGCGADFDGIELHRPSLDDVFLNKTGRSLRES